MNISTTTAFDGTAARRRAADEQNHPRSWIRIFQQVQMDLTVTWYDCTYSNCIMIGWNSFEQETGHLSSNGTLPIIWLSSVKSILNLFACWYQLYSYQVEYRRRTTSVQLTIARLEVRQMKFSQMNLQEPCSFPQGSVQWRAPHIGGEFKMRGEFDNQRELWHIFAKVQNSTLIWGGVSIRGQLENFNQGGFRNSPASQLSSEHILKLWERISNSPFLRDLRASWATLLELCVFCWNGDMIWCTAKQNRRSNDRCTFFLCCLRTFGKC